MRTRNWFLFLLILLFTLPACAQDSLNISMVGSTYHNWDSAHGVEGDGIYSYIAGGNGGLVVLDVADPANPIEVGFLETVLARNLFLNGNYLFIASEWDGFHIVDVSQPQNPALLATRDTFDYCINLAVRDTLVFTADWGSGLMIFDISDFDRFIPLIGTYSTDYPVRDVELAGENALLANGSGGMKVIDVSNPADPVEISSFTADGAVIDVALQANLAFLATDENRVQIVNMEAPDSPEEIVSWITPSLPSQTIPQGNFLYISLGDGGLQILDISDLQNLTEAASLPLSGSTVQSEVVNNTAFCASLEGGVHLVDVSSPHHPVEQGQYDPPNHLVDVQAVGNYAFLLDRNVGMRVIYTMNPSSPVEVASMATPGDSYSLSIWSDLAFIADASGGVQIVDINNRQSPQIITSYGEGGFISDVVVHGNYAYLTDRFTGLKILNISVPEDPVEFFSRMTFSDASNIALDPPYAYISLIGSENHPGDGAGLAIMDIDNPYLPEELAFLPSPDTPGDVQVYQGFVYQAVAEEGVRIINAIDPQAPVVTGTINEITNPAKMAVVDDYLLVASGEQGLQIFYLGDPSQPLQSGYYVTPGLAFGVSVSGMYAYVADGGFFGIYDVGSALFPVTVETPLASLPVGFSVSDPYPNPFNSAFRLQISVPSSGEMKVGIYNTIGRLVLRDHFSVSAGLHVYESAALFGNADLSGGRYFVELDYSGQQVIQQLIYLK